MAIPQIKVTYSLDEATCQRVELLAQLWSKSKSEVIRDAISLINLDEIRKADKLNTLSQLQKKKRKQNELAQWAKTSRDVWR